jgi:hypothetical protein
VGNLQRIGFQIHQDEQEPILGLWQRTVGIGGVRAGGARLAIEPPLAHIVLKSNLKGRHKDLKFVERQAGEIENFGWFGLNGAEAQAGHAICLLSERQYIINRNKL